uniref:CAZy families GT8 protein n=1 Tax=uncultured Streptococcus sp. TaxID=83427 RepID=A0A060CE97_9STRE|nr:CAZy families GT8 protein [uncultured Streptococcus sp.]
MNSLYGGRIYSIPDQIYNYDARKSLVYEMISGGSWDLNWVIEHTVFLHFCGRDKPWKKDYRSKFCSTLQTLFAFSCKNLKVSKPALQIRFGG